MSEPSLEDLNQNCPYCGGVVRFYADSCSRCRRQVHPPHRLRIMGVIYLILGLALTGGIGYLGVVLAQIIRHSGDPHASVRYTGGPLGVLFIYAVLAFPMGVGLTVLLMGISQIRNGRRNLKLVQVMLYWYLLLIGISLVLQAADWLHLLPAL